jgi:hypothetical protein
VRATVWSVTALAEPNIWKEHVIGLTQKTFVRQLTGKGLIVAKRFPRKRVRKRGELVKHAVAKALKQPWSPHERFCQNVLQLNGIKNPTLETVRQVIRQQQLNETNRKYKELTK